MRATVTLATGLQTHVTGDNLHVKHDPNAHAWQITGDGPVQSGSNERAEDVTLAWFNDREIVSITLEQTEQSCDGGGEPHLSAQHARDDL